MQLESLDTQERLAGAVAIASLFEGGTSDEDQATVSLQHEHVVRTPQLASREDLTSPTHYIS